MPLAYLPSPATGQWRLGPLSVHLYTLCVVLGICIAIAVGERRYRAAGGRRWAVLDVATVAVPAGLLGAWAYRLVFGFGTYFGHGRDWVDVLRIWDGGLGLPGAAVGSLAATWLWCRRRGAATGPVLTAVVPGVAFGQAVGLIGNWFAQTMYGPPSSMPWAVAISPVHRAPGYESFTYFQPLFLYQALWEIAVGVALVVAIRRLRLTGFQALVVLVGCYAVGWLATASFILGGSQRQPATTAGQFAAAVLVVLAAVYLYLTRSARGPEPLRADASRAPGGIRTHT